MNLQGRIRKIEDTQTFKSDFKKRSLILTTDEKYPQHVSIDFLQDKVSILDQYKTGDNVNISINIRGKEWINPEGETKYFNSIVGWRIENLTNTQNSNLEVIPPSVNENIDLEKDKEEDDFPF